MNHLLTMRKIVVVVQSFLLSVFCMLPRGVVLQSHAVGLTVFCCWDMSSAV
ncbi:uncharacterized protein LACBIDRAFT_306983 [Laccaria bicolor S238N-H82]|uniref:Predicted protein n=1 Tax=Laccaria bicolor (strain S238N-H82 / ATCC MYA-4686) TaxID=486041 RepID=B0DP39_LACBS|nr:uncharacterized protein LACBIDRAFT_306983 [Laccaria bicolor S238N-H82]EDR03546.1 predicted protein [Laccaria bicolor S238N-H82]|eukprot:XP_001885694.1 predicted protein [Laccaria bicolor S238N-H82]